MLNKEIKCCYLPKELKLSFEQIQSNVTKSTLQLLEDQFEDTNLLKITTFQNLEKLETRKINYQDHDKVQCIFCENFITNYLVLLILHWELEHNEFRVFINTHQSQNKQTLCVNIFNQPDKYEQICFFFFFLEKPMQIQDKIEFVLQKIFFMGELEIPNKKTLVYHRKQFQKLNDFFPQADFENDSEQLEKQRLQNLIADEKTVEFMTFWNTHNKQFRHEIIGSNFVFTNFIQNKQEYYFQLLLIIQNHTKIILEFESNLRLQIYLGVLYGLIDDQQYFEILYFLNQKIKELNQGILSIE